MKIYRKIVLSLRTGQVLIQDGYRYEGPIAECKGGGGGTTTTEPNPAQAPYLADIMGQAQFASQTPMQFYPGQITAGFTPAQTAAQQATLTRATQGSPLMGQGQSELAKTMGGEYYGAEYNNPLVSGQRAATISGQFLSPESNPWLEATYRQAAAPVMQTFSEATMPQIRRQAMAEGAYGGGRQGVSEGIAGRGLAEALSGISTSLYGQNYQQERSRQEAATAAEQDLLAKQYEAERGRQVQAVGAAPAYAVADYTDIGKIAAVGEEQQAMDQAMIDQARKAWEFYQTEPWQRLGMYSNLVTGDTGGITTSTSSGGK